MKNRIRVIHVVNTLGMGGTEKTVELLVKSLPRSKFDISVIAISAGGKRAVSLQRHKISVVVLAESKESLETYLASHQADIIHLHYIKVDLRYFSSTQKLIFHHHFSQPLYTKQEYQQFRYVIFNSHRTRQKFYELTHSKFQSHRDLMIYNPADNEELLSTLKTISEKRIHELKKELKILDDEIVLGRLGRPDIVKWSDTIIFSLPIIFSKAQNVKIILQNVPVSREWLLKHSPWSNKLIINPKYAEENEVAVFFALIDIYIHASKIGESFGMSLVEASACKKPLVVTSTPKVDNAQIEVVDHGKTGLIVKNPVEFAHAILQLIDSSELRKKLGENGSKKVNQKYGVKNIASQIQQVYFDEINPEENRIDYDLWNNEYQRRLLKTYSYTPTILEKIYLNVIRIVTICTRVSDWLEHRLS